MKDFKKIINNFLKSDYEINSVLVIEEGVNGKSYKIILDNQKYFLKIYPKDKFNKHERIISELSFIEFLKKNNFTNIPEIITYSRLDNWILFKWVKGTKIKKISENEVKLFIKFLIEIQSFRDKNILYFLPNASEACFSLLDHQKLIKSKLSKTLQSINKLINIKKDLISDINSEFLKKLITIKKQKAKYANYENFWNYIIKIDERCISPSDVGFHNIMKTQNNLFFFDFEYSGVDDPVKLIVDLMIQPDYPIPENKVFLIKDFTYIFKNKIPFFKNRIEVMLNLYQIKWFCIIFNPIIKNKLKSNSESLYLIFKKACDYYAYVESKKSKLLEQIY